MVKTRLLKCRMHNTYRKQSLKHYIMKGENRMLSIPNINYITDPVNPEIDSDSSLYRIPFYKDVEYFSNSTSYEQFIRYTEKLVRNNKRYKAYISYLKNDVGLTECQVLPDLPLGEDDDSKVDIEMHHGPIFTLYDYVTILIEYFDLKGMKISTFRIADTLLREHELDNIQVVMLSATAHEEVHNKNIFISYKQGYGRLNRFIKKYGVGINIFLREKLNKYIDRSRYGESKDYKQVLELNELIYKLSN